MTRLRPVDANFRPDAGHSIRVPLTDECLADLEAITRLVLAPAELGVRELREAISLRDRDAAIPALRRLLAVGLIAKEWADFVEREPA
jgi:hypothetical protein